MKDPFFFIHHIQECIESLEVHLGKITKKDFLKSAPLQALARYNIMIIGEASKSVPSSLRERYPTIPWKMMAGMRDILIHHYYELDEEEIWKTVRVDIPLLKSELEKVI